jgi:hypothetical protein
MSDADLELELYLGQKLYFYLVDTAETAMFWGQSLLPLSRPASDQPLAGIHLTMTIAAITSLR